MNTAVLRILDANLNRAREALRVSEDYARFVLNDEALCGSLKALRHELATAAEPVVGNAILHRDTPGDVGTTTKTQAELTREDAAHVVTAAGKRLGEALRTIEEYLKTIDAGAAARVEALRYRFYDIEHQLAFTLRPAAGGFASVRLYVLITASACKRPWLETAQLAIEGGADCLQLREKDFPGGEFLDRARQLVALCRTHGVISIINDRPDIALLSDADGVHVGQDDLPARDVRRLLGRDKIVGVSTHRLEHARQAVLDGADYVGVGPMYKSGTKPRDFVAGLDYARAVASAELPIPAVAIAGITEENVDEVMSTGLRAVAVTAAVAGCDDVRGAASRLKQKLVKLMRNQTVGQTFLSAVPVAQTFLSVSEGHSCPSDGSRDTGKNAGATKEGVLRVTTRNLPHWRLDGSTYFVTFRLLRGTITMDERVAVVNHVRAGHGKFYDLIAMVVMPDHAHILLTPLPGVDLSRITKGTKGVTARLINEQRGTTGSIWQDESWDRIIRDQAELDEKLQYMFDNPVKVGLATDGWEYGAFYLNPQAG